MHSDYLGILLLLGVAAILCGAMVTLSWVLGPKKVTPYKASPYECGVQPMGDAKERFPIKFYLVGIVFILFDIEVIFLWSWMTVYNNPSLFATAQAHQDFIVYSFWAVMVYMALWILSDVYVLRVGAIDWDETTSLDPAKFGEAQGVLAHDGPAVAKPALAPQGGE